MTPKLKTKTDRLNEELKQNLRIYIVRRTLCSVTPT